MPDQNQFYQQPMYGGYANPYAAPQMMTYGQPQMGGFMYNQNQKMPEFTNPLGAKAKTLLEQGNGAPRLQITEDDMNKAICTHRYNGELQLVPISDGKVKCKICGAEFHPVDNATEEDVDKAVENLHDIMHTSKMMWLDVPDNVAVENFQVLAVVDQVPKIFSIAQDRLKKYSGFNPIAQTGQINGFNLLNNIMGPGLGFGFGQQPMMQQPMYGQPMMQGYQMPQQQMMTPMQQQMTAQAPGMSNGFGYSSAPVQMQPIGQQVAQPVQQPQAQPAAQNQTAPANNGGATVTNQLHV